VEVVWGGERKPGDLPEAHGGLWPEHRGRACVGEQKGKRTFRVDFGGKMKSRRKQKSYASEGDATKKQGREILCGQKKKSFRKGKKERCIRKGSGEKKKFHRKRETLLSKQRGLEEGRKRTRARLVGRRGPKEKGQESSCFPGEKFSYESQGRGGSGGKRGLARREKEIEKEKEICIGGGGKIKLGKKISRNQGEKKLRPPELQGGKEKTATRESGQKGATLNFGKKRGFLPSEGDPG